MRDRIFQLIKQIMSRHQWVDRLLIMGMIEGKYVEKVFHLYKKYLVCLGKSETINEYTIIMCVVKTKYINLNSICVSFFPVINFHQPMTLVNTNFYVLMFNIYFGKYRILYFTYSVIETIALSSYESLFCN